MRRSLRLSCQEQLLPGGTLEEKWAAAQAMGFQAIELRGAGDGAFARRLPELRRAAANGVPMPTVCVEMSHFVGAFDPDLRRDAVVQLRSQLSTIAALGGRLAMTPASYGMFSRRLPPFEPPRSAEDDQKVLVEVFGELAEHALSEGVVIALEPLNRYEDHMVNTLAAASEVCEAVGSPALRIAADTYHMNIEEADPAAALIQAAPYLAHVQVSDSNRLEPGAGHLDWGTVLAALEAIGFKHELAYECRLSGPAEQALPRSTAFLRRMA
ncbi:MAG TPA: sugar phosphate isomerase/epimerase family protein [Kribbella sp.]|nr:sugar phosphate isomerase/epimerase family protein [Kribbella sp.]